MGKSTSQKQWLKEHFDDPYVRQSHVDGYRSRASYKLIELQEKHALFKPGHIIVDLGAAPGGWSQLLVKWVGKNGHIISLDLLEMEPIEGVTFIQGDFASDQIYNQLIKLLGNKKVDWVVSDIAPNLSGNKTTDQARSIHLMELALDFAKTHLKMNGGFLVKVFQGSGFQEFLADARHTFKQVSTKKPKASRNRSSECYLLGITKNECYKPK